MDDAKLAGRLQEFGLSSKEADAYLTILRHGEAKASVVAEDAGVSKRYVYSVSEELENRGFVEVNDHAVPTMIRANPPGEVLGRLSTTLESLEPELDARYTDVARTLDEFDVIKEERLVGTRQSLLEPATSSFPVENALRIETEGGERTVGGPGAFVEDYRTTRVRFLEAD